MTSNHSSSPLTVGFCGTGEYSVICAQALKQDPRFEVSWVITPEPKPIGRKKIVTPSPLDEWATQQNLPVVHVATKLKDIKSKILELPKVDYLLVVSFGYLIPTWLLDFPKIGSVNVHPSDLPKYRGSSPGQFVILYGEKTSAVSIMLMNNKFDQGAIIRQLPIEVSPLENQTSYYHKAFALAQDNLPQVLQEYAENRLSQTQSVIDDTAPLARRLSREDGFVSQAIISSAAQEIQQISAMDDQKIGPVLQELVTHQPNLSPAQLLDRALRALSPWPGIWTIVPEYKGKQNVRQKILDGKLLSKNKFLVTKIQFDGEAPQEI